MTENNITLIKMFFEKHSDIRLKNYDLSSNYENLFGAISMVERKFNVKFSCVPMLTKCGNGYKTSRFYKCTVNPAVESYIDIVKVMGCKSRIEAYENALLNFMTIHIIGDTEADVDASKRLKVDISVYLIDIWNKMEIVPENHADIVREIYAIGDFDLNANEEERTKEIKKAYQKWLTNLLLHKK